MRCYIFHTWLSAFSLSLVKNCKTYLSATTFPNDMCWYCQCGFYGPACPGSPKLHTSQSLDSVSLAADVVYLNMYQLINQLICTKKSTNTCFFLFCTSCLKPQIRLMKVLMLQLFQRSSKIGLEVWGGPRTTTVDDR